jgi:CheY-like chemotaxis protein
VEVRPEGPGEELSELTATCSLQIDEFAPKPSGNRADYLGVSCSGAKTRTPRRVIVWNDRLLFEKHRLFSDLQQGSLADSQACVACFKAQSGPTGTLGDPPLNQPTVVVADDNPALLYQMVALMKPEFDVVATAENGLLALEVVRQYRPDVVVLDLWMPILNGLEIARQLTQSASTARIVICSVETDPEIIQSTKQAGALGYVFKLSMTRDLVAAVKAAIRGEAFESSLWV